MERLIESQESLALIYKKYNEIAATPLAPLNMDDEDALKTLLNTVMNRESVSNMKNKKPAKESAELRSSIADVLLLLDGCDIQEIKANMKKSTSAEATD